MSIINISPTNNEIIVTNNNYQIIVIDNNCGNSLTVTQPQTNVVEIYTGHTGYTGPSGSAGPTGSSQPFSLISGSTWGTTSSIEITGSLTISGSNTFKNIGPAVFTGSVNITGSLFINGNTTSSFTGSYNLPPDNKILFGTGSAGIYNISSVFGPNTVALGTKYDLSESHLLLKNGQNEWHDDTINGFISIIAGSTGNNSIQLDGGSNDKVSIFSGVGGINLNGNTTGNFTGSLLGTSSFASSSQYATTASYALNVIDITFPYTGSAIISGSLIITGSLSTNNDISLTGGNRLISSTNGNLRLNAASGNSLRLDIGGNPIMTVSSNNISTIGNFNITGSNIISGSLTVTGSANFLLDSTQDGIKFIGSGSNPYIHLNQSTPGLTNYALRGNGTSTTILNATSQVDIDINNSLVLRVTNTGLTLDSAKGIIFNTATGGYLATATNQRIGFYGVTPISQSISSTAIDTVLTNMGLRASGGTSNFDTPITASSTLYVSGSGVFKNGLEISGSFNLTGSLTSSAILVTATSSNPSIVIKKGSNSGFIQHDGGAFQFGTISNQGMEIYTNSSLITRVNNSGNWSFNNGINVTGSFNSTGSINALVTGSSLVNIGNLSAVTASLQRLVTISQDNAWISLGSYASSPSNAVIYGSQISPGGTNYSLLLGVNSTSINAPNGNIELNYASTTRYTFASNSITFSPTTISTGAITNFLFNVSSATGQTSTSEIPNFKIIGNNKTWTSGNIPTQRWNWFTANTASFSSTSTIGESFGLFAEAAIMGTNATCSNNYGFGVSGSIKLANLNTSIFCVDTTGVARSILNFNLGENIVLTGKPGTTDIILNPTNGGVGLYVKGSNGSIGAGVASPTALFHLRSGSVASAAAPLKFSTGSFQSTPELGAVEFNGQYLTITTGSIRNLLLHSNNPASITGSLTITGSQNIQGSLTASQALFSSSGTNQLTIIGSGSNNPLFTVQGSQGELFSITDNLSGSLFSVNDISGLPILEVFSDSTTIIGDYQAPSLYTTKKILANSGNNIIYNIPTSSYDSIFYDYSIKSGSDYRTGHITATWSGSSINYLEHNTSSLGSPSGFIFGVFITGSNVMLTGSSTTNGWTVKTIIRSI